jgi:glutamate formiminotransferase
MASLECVVNVSEGRSASVLAALRGACGSALLDVHTDPHHHRSVFTLAGADTSAALRSLAAAAVSLLDIRSHAGVHPRIGVVDVVPFVPLAGLPFAAAVRERDAFAAWMTSELGVPCLLYGPERTLPALRREAASMQGHPSAGLCAVGARDVLVAYNVWLEPGVPVSVARQVAAAIRSDAVRALGLDVGGRTQVSCNLVQPAAVGPADVYDQVAARAPVDGGELVGLLPAAVLSAVPARRWPELGLSADATIEARLNDRAPPGS